MAQSKLSKSTNVDQRSVTFTTEADDVYTVTLDRFPADIVTRLALHGLSQKLGDCFAGQSLSEGVARFEATLENLERGQWQATQHGALAQAVSNLTGQPLSDVRAMLDTLDKAAKSKLRRDPKVKAELVRMEQERLGDTSDQPSMLDTLFADQDA